MKPFFSPKDSAFVFFFNGLILVGLGSFIYLMADFGDPINLEIRLQNERIGKIIFLVSILLFVFITALAILWATNHKWPGYPIIGISFLHIIGSGIVGYFMFQISQTFSFVLILVCIIDALIIWNVAHYLYHWKQLEAPLTDQHSS